AASRQAPSPCVSPHQPLPHGLITIVVASGAGNAHSAASLPTFCLFSGRHHWLSVDWDRCAPLPCPSCHQSPRLPRLRSWLSARVACSGAVRRCMPPFLHAASPVSIRADWPWPCRRVSTLSVQGAAMDEAVWHTLATPSLTDSTQTARSGLARAQRALFFALVALLTTTFIGGGLFAAALALVVLSRRPAETALMVPAPV